MKFPKKLIAGSLALGMMVTSARAEDPAPVPTVCLGVPTVYLGVPDACIGLVVDQEEAPDTQVYPCVLPPAPRSILIGIGIDGEEEVIKIDGVNTLIRTGTDDPLILASSSGQINTMASATPAITTDAGKDEASTAKAAGISAPAKSIASVAKRTSAVVKSGRVFLTH